MNDEEIRKDIESMPGYKDIIEQLQKFVARMSKEEQEEFIKGVEEFYPEAVNLYKQLKGEK